MANYFLDSSALVKRYHLESDTDRVLDLFNQPGNQIYVSRLTLVELRSAFAVKVRTGHIVDTTALALWVQVLEDVASGIFEVLPITEVHYQRAGELIGRYGFRHRLRTLDAIQLAIASSYRERAPIDGLVLADRVLSEVAQAENIPVLLLV